MSLAKNNFKKTKLSLTAKLTLFYALSTICLLAVICLFSYFALSEIVFRGNQTFLTDEMNLIKNALIQKPNDLTVLKEQAQEIPHALDGSVYRFFVRIADEHNHEIIKTTKAESVFNDKTKYPYQKNLYWVKSNLDEDFLVMQEIDLPHKKIIQIALNVTYQYQLIKDYRNKEYFKLILSIFVISALAAIFLGYIVARKGLQQLLDLVNTSKKISTDNLNQRLQIDNWPKELIAVGQSFNDMLNRIEKGYAKLSQFSADLAHELRTPLNNLLLQTELALSNEYEEIEFKKILESNLEELEQLKQIIENILFLARSENINEKLEKTSLKVEEEIDSIIDFFRIFADEKNIQITRHGKGNLVANRIMLRRLITNLLSNAVNYNKQNGYINFTIQLINNNSLEISVIDSGMGISPKNLELIGNRFYKIQGHAFNASQKKSIGLGLAIVKSIVQIHRGTFSIVSELDKGTRITIVFPTD